MAHENCDYKEALVDLLKLLQQSPHVKWTKQPGDPESSNTYHTLHTQKFRNWLLNWEHLSPYLRNAGVKL